MKIEIYTRSMNWQLFKLSSGTLTLPYQRRRCRFTTADGYFYNHVLKSSADVILNIDEDAFVTDNGSLQRLVEFCLDNDYVNCGVPDGGVMDIRKHNPVVTNPFFNILNVSKIKKDFDRSIIQRNYNEHRPEFEKHAPHHLLKSKYEYDFYEPYVPFFLWLNTNFKTLFLDAEEHHDGFSNVLLDHENNPFLLHSWYSRFYGTDDFHTKRINELYKEATTKEISNKKTFADLLIEKSDELGMKYYVPIKNRISNLIKK